MSPSTLLFLITLLALVVFVVTAWKASRRSEEKISALEARLEAAGAAGDAGGAGEARLASAAGDASAAATPSGALARISAYLQHAVAAPIREGLERGGEELRVRADEALAALEDMEFFVEDRELDLAPHDLHLPLREVIDEYCEEFDVPVRVRDEDTELRAGISVEAFKDAVYLVLVNAGRFGRGNPVEVSLQASGDHAILRIRDHGPGFGPEALRRATEPFFTTEEGALGMGLAHASRLLREHDGELVLGNSPRGGGQVELRLPRA